MRAVKIASHFNKNIILILEANCERSMSLPYNMNSCHIWQCNIICIKASSPNEIHSHRDRDKTSYRMFMHKFVILIFHFPSSTFSHLHSDNNLSINTAVFDL